MEYTLVRQDIRMMMKVMDMPQLFLLVVIVVYAQTANSDEGNWLLSGALAIPPLIGWGKYDFLESQSFCFCDWKTSISYTFFMVGMCFGGPCSAMTFCYVNILRKVRESKRRIAQATQIRGPSREETSNTTVNTANSVSARHGTATCFRIFTCRSLQNPSTIVKPDETAQVEPTLAHQSSGQHSETSTNGPANRDQNPNVVGGRSEQYQSNLPDVVSRGHPDRSYTVPNKKVVTFSGPGLDSTRPVDRLAPPSIRQGSHALNAADIKREQAQRRSKDELKLTKSFLVVIFLFIVCWLPYCISMFYYVFSGRLAPRHFDMLTVVLGCTNSACNPIIYGLMNRKFKEGFIKLYFPKYYQKMLNVRNSANVPMKSGLD